MHDDVERSRERLYRAQMGLEADFARIEGAIDELWSQDRWLEDLVAQTKGDIS